MSDVLYPISIGPQASTAYMDRTLVDGFENGNTSSRRLWGDKYFKRKFTLQHAGLTAQELSHFLGFYRARGTYDSFWYRDNVLRGGNAKVRFAHPIDVVRAKGNRAFPVELHEVAPIPMLPELPDIYDAVLAYPQLWFDANRESYFLDRGSAVTGDAYDHSGNNRHSPWFSGQAGTNKLSLGAVLGQYQYYEFYTGISGGRWTKTPSNVTHAYFAQPPIGTVFLITKSPTMSTKTVLFQLGAMGAGKAIGIAISAANKYEPYVGGSETWATASSTNSPSSTWRSVAAVWSGSNVAELLVNGTSIGLESYTAAFTAGPATMGAAIDGSLSVDSGGTYIAHAILFANQLNATTLKALHNVFAYQYGMATV